MKFVLFIASGWLVLGSGVLEAQQPATVAGQPRVPAEAQVHSEAELATLGAGNGAFAARNESTAPWIWGGFAGGATLGPIGTGLAWYLANNSRANLDFPRAMMLSAEGGPVYLQSYERAYAETLRARRKQAALVGGALGTAALGAGIFAAWAVYYYYP